MATRIIHKKSSTASSVPVAGDLEPGELALNLADQKIYSKTTGGTIIELGGAGATISAYGATLIDDADAATARTTLDVDQAGTAIAMAIALG